MALICVVECSVRILANVVEELAMRKIMAGRAHGLVQQAKNFRLSSLARRLSARKSTSANSRYIFANLTGQLETRDSLSSSSTAELKLKNRNK
jgi:hypothetical protein